MIEIKKGREPRKLLHYRQQQGATYEQMDREVKDELLGKLLYEQGHICAYCMRRIPENRDLHAEMESVSIEHWLPRHPEDKEDVGQALDYRNLLAVCSGNRGCGCKEKLICDARKGNERITVNPCDADTLRGITYTASGRIQSSNPIIDEDLNERLNLNCDSASLPENRKRVLQALIEDIKRKREKGDITSYCKKKLENIKKMDDPKLPYVGILIWWLEKHSK